MILFDDTALWYRFARASSGSLFYPLMVMRFVQSLAGTAQALVVTWLLSQIVRDRPVDGQLMALAGCVVATMGLQVVLGYFATVTKERVQCHINREILDVVTDIPTIEYRHSPVAADRIAYLRRETWRVMDTAWAPYDLVVTIANLALVAVIIGAIQPLLLLVPVLSLSRVLGSIASSRRANSAARAAATHYRRLDTLVALAASPDHVMELQVYKARDLILAELAGDADRATRALTRDLRIAALLSIAGRIVFRVGYCTVIGLILFKASGLSSDRAASALILLVLLMVRIERVSSGLATGGTQFSQLMFFLRELEAFREYGRGEHEQWNDNETDSVTGLSLESVSFKYPEQQSRALDEVSFRVAPGTVVALVGRNGAGKTTLAELILGLYRAKSGAVVRGWRGRGLAESNQPDEVSASLQQGARFNFSLRDAVVLGRATPAEPADAGLWHAVLAAKTDELVRSLPSGPDTVLGTIFIGSRELSGGEWQRVSNAAALFPSRPSLLVLDEPTSAIDPRVEESILQSLLAASRAVGELGGITLIVSHRLALAKDVDLVLVLEKGRVVEAGQHEQLMDRGGRYARMYARQRAMYR